jgi:glycosyltransferase involved in cell wall biosynthesis
MTSPEPLVSCIMPTRDRRGFVSQAVAYFLRQDWPARELVVVDDGEKPVDDLLPADSRITYLRLDGTRSVGAKRNLACATGRGELIAHWDDDDWIRADRLRLQVAELRRSGAAACGLGELLCYRPAAAEAWTYRPLAGDPPWLAGGTLLYRRDAWAAHPFPDVDVGEGDAFVSALDRRRLAALADTSWYLGLLHGRNTAPTDLGDRRWRTAPLQRVADRLDGDRAFYAALRAGGGGRARPVRALPDGGSTITLVAPFLVYDGYGSMAEYTALGLRRAGAELRLAPLLCDRAGLSAELLGLLDRPGQGSAGSVLDPSVLQRSGQDGPVLYESRPGPELEALAGTPELFVRTMWESSRLPAGWPARLDRARAVIVPTRFVAQVCRASGVTAPVEVVPEGVDPAVYRYEPREGREGVTTLMVGTLVGRKHVAEGVAAWKLAFAADPTARLIVKARFRAGRLEAGDPRIRVVDAEEPSRGIAHWYRQADVLLALGNEGFGLPLVEGMATGLPVVALAAEGQLDVCREAPDLLLPVPPARFEPFMDLESGRCGVCAVPDVDAAAAQLRWVGAHREEAAELGRAASSWAHRHRDVWAKGPRILEVMEHHAHPRRPLRRLRTIWAPGRAGRGGVAGYTAELVAALGPGIRVSPAAPDPAAVRLLHLQHEPGRLDDTDLAARLRRARDRGVPVVVTGHAVAPDAAPWEAAADALVALTGMGAGRLRARWPGRRVELIPRGCPTWFPPRKRRRGRVVGALGDLDGSGSDGHRGAVALLEALRALPGTELVLYGQPGPAAEAAAWARAAAGLPVRWHRGRLPAEQVARRLAAEADLLAFWYDELPTASASGAVQVGLASGVPVLTSPTGWFSDLCQATFQPGDLIGGITRLLDDTRLRDEVTAAARDHCHDHAWPRVARAHQRLWDALEVH